MNKSEEILNLLDESDKHIMASRKAVDDISGGFRDLAQALDKLGFPSKVVKNVRKMGSDFMKIQKEMADAEKDMVS